MVPNHVQSAAASLRAGQLAWSGWLILGIVMSVMVYTGDEHSVWPNYRDAGIHWQAGEDLYHNVPGHGFLYCPQAAVFFSPFSNLPEPFSGMAWRAFSLALFVAGIRRFSGLLPGDAHLAFLLASAVSLPLCFAGFRNGQASLVMTGLLLLAIDALARFRVNQGVILLAISIAIKPLGLVVALLAAGVKPRLSWRLGIALLLAGVSPFLFQRSEYVWNQYQLFLDTMRAAEELGNSDWFAQLFGMLRVFGYEVPGTQQMMIRLAAAPLTLALCIALCRRVSWNRAMVWTYTLGVVYLMLFNPRTENNTYCMLGPAIGYFAADEWILQRRKAQIRWLVAITVAITGGYVLALPFTPEGARPVWLAPLGCIVFAVYLATRIREDWSASQVSHEATASTMERCEARPRAA